MFPPGDTHARPSQDGVDRELLLPGTEKPGRELGEFSCHAGAWNYQVNAGSFRCVPGLDVDVGVVAENWDAKSHKSFRVLGVQIDHEEVCVFQGSFSQDRRQRHFVTGGAERSLDLAAQQQILGDCDYASHKLESFVALRI